MLKPEAFRTFFPMIQKDGFRTSCFGWVMFDQNGQPYLIEQAVQGAVAAIPLDPRSLQRIRAHDHNFVYHDLVVLDLPMN